MPVFRGNVGNLLQHWVLCEVLAAWQGCANRIDFIDAYSMAPLADERPKRDPSARTFDFVQRRLPGDQTPYERAWHALAPGDGHYPNSAALLTVAWPGDYSLLLCESDPSTVRQLREWGDDIASEARCVGVEIAEGDWRNRFRQGLDASGDLTLLSFDPYLVNQRVSGRNPANMDPRDMELIAAAVRSVQRPIVIQLSTYSANGGNPQPAVLDATDSRLEPAGFERLGVARLDGHMMSMLYGRDLGEGPRLGDLPERFSSWLAQVKAGCAGHGV
jgi:hypothetical protein